MPSQAQLQEQRNRFTLSITIPTYNRVGPLRQTIDRLIPQITNQVELVVFDNCSTDGTEDYLKTLPPHVGNVRQSANIGPDRNMLSCLSAAKGEYVWLLCDDDIIEFDIVAKILSSIAEFTEPPLIYLRSQGRPPKEGAENSLWVEESASEFIEDISYWITFCSSIVVRRDLIDLPFLRRQIGGFLIPTALVLSVISARNRAIVSRKQLVRSKLGESGAYDALGIFGSNLRQLLRSYHDVEVFEPGQLRTLYRSNLRQVVGSYLLLTDWPIRFRSAARSILSSVDCSELYTIILPRLFMRIVIRPTRRRLRRLLSRIIPRSISSSQVPATKKPE